jgi:hypothetical protein
MGFTLLTGEVGTGTPMGKLIFFNQTGVFFGMRVKF